jgi:GTP cyclohydrolase FolE2
MRKTVKIQPAKMVTVKITAEARHQLKVTAAKRGMSIVRLVSELAENTFNASDFRVGSIVTMRLGKRVTAK